MKKILGYILIGIAVSIALSTLVAGIWDLIWAFNIPPTSLRIKGVQTGIFIAVVVYSLILGGIATVLFLWGLSLVNPAKYSKQARDGRLLQKIYAQENLANRSLSAVTDELYYDSKTGAELDSIYHAIDREKVPDRFEALLATIKKKVEELH